MILNLLANNCCHVGDSATCNCTSWSQRFPGARKQLATYRGNVSIRVTQRLHETGAALARRHRLAALHDHIKHGCRVNNFPLRAHHVSGHSYLKHQV